MTVLQRGYSHVQSLRLPTLRRYVRDTALIAQALSIRTKASAAIRSHLTPSLTRRVFVHPNKNSTYNAPIENNAATPAFRRHCIVSPPTAASGSAHRYTSVTTLNHPMPYVVRSSKT